MKRPAVIAFAKDWHEDPTSNHHVLAELARSRRVLWLNSIGTRTPRLSSGRDLRKVRRKVGELVRGPVNVQDDLWVFSPPALPLHGNAAVRRVNRALLRRTIAGLRRSLGLSEFHLWTFLPNVADYVGALGESLSVYYCVDEWSLFTHLDGGTIADAEQRLLAKVDCVFAVNEALAEKKLAANGPTHVARHGVDHALFARALDPHTVVPAELARLPRPVIGFYGTLRDWVDLDILVYVARTRPGWSIALIGQELDDMAPLRALPNVHLLGKKAHADLPAYCKGMDVGIIPYRLGERMHYVSPIKLREYLSAGLPVVSTAVPEVRRFEEWCAIAGDGPSFVGAIERALASDSAALRARRSRAMTVETWPMRVAEVERIVDALDRRRRHRRGET